MGKITILEMTEPVNTVLLEEIIPSLLRSNEKLVLNMGDIGNYWSIKKGRRFRRGDILILDSLFHDLPLEISVYSRRGLEIAKSIAKEDRRDVIIQKYFRGSASTVRDGT